MTILIKHLVLFKAIMKELAQFLYVVWEYGGVLSKLLIGTILSSITFPFFLVFEKYVFNDWEFFGFWVVAITCDLLSGIWKHLKSNTFCVRDMTFKFGEKIFISLLFMVLSNVISWMMGAEKGDTMDVWWSFIGRATILSWIIISAGENTYEITGGKFPPIGWMKRFKKFNETGDLTDLKNEPLLTEDVKPTTN